MNRAFAYPTAVLLLAAFAGPNPSVLAQEPFALERTADGLRLELDDIAADDALRQLAGEYGFELVWRVRTPPLRISGWRQGDVAAIVSWILRGYDYAMVTAGSGERTPQRVVVFAERNPNAASPPVAPEPDPMMPSQEGVPSQLPTEPGMAPGDITDFPPEDEETPPIELPPEIGADGEPPPDVAPYDPAPEDLPP